MKNNPEALNGLNLSAYDSLNANICIIDQTGMIIAVNKAWRDFANSNPPVIKDYRVGVNYLNLCDSAFGYCSEEAKSFAEGLRSVINGSRNEFGLEYPCNSPWEERWFIGWITPLLNTEKMGGKLRVDSKYGEGSTFTFSIPLEKVGNQTPGYENKQTLMAELL